MGDMADYILDQYVFSDDYLYEPYEEFMSTAKGVVTKVHEKTKTAAGKSMRSPAYSILLDDSDWYNFGFDKPACGEGDVISFNYTEGQWGNEGEVGTVNILDDSTPEGKSASAKSNNVQESIVYQSSLKIAAEVVSIALTHEALSLPTKKADRFDFVMDVVEETARSIAVRALNPELTATVPEPADDE